MLQQLISSLKQRMKKEKLLMLRMKLHSCVQIFAIKKVFAFYIEKVALVVFSELAIDLYSFIVFRTSLFIFLVMFYLSFSLSLSLSRQMVTVQRQYKDENDICNLLFYSCFNQMISSKLFATCKKCSFDQREKG